MMFIIVILLLSIDIPYAATDCNWPANMQSSIWHDSDKGELNFESKTMSGLDYEVQGNPIDTWDCLYYFEATGFLIMKSQSTVTLFSTVYRPYQCVVLSTITDYSYTYYIHAGKEIRVGNERINLREESSTTGITESNAVESLCDSSTVTENEYHMLVKDGWETDARQDCPGNLIYEFYYSVNDGSTTSCGTENEHWNACDVANKIEFDYSLCSSEIAYSTSGSVYCMATVASGGFNLVTVMNEDSGSTYIFSCFMYEAASNGTIYLSQSPMSCTSSQTPTTIPQHPDGAQGLLLVLDPYQTSQCDPTTTSTTTSTTTTTPTTTTTTPTTTTTTPTTTTTTATTTTTTLTTTTTTPTTTTTTVTTTTTTPTTTTTTTPTTTTTTPTTTTTTPTTTTTTPTTTTTTPTTTTTTPTTTTTTPTTTTTTPTTTTTTPTTTTTTPTTTTTTSTTTTTTPTTTTTTPTTTTSEITTPAPTTTTKAPDNTLTIIAAILGGLAVLLVLMLIVAFVVYRCCKPPPVTPSPEPDKTPEPDVIIDALPHTLSGLSAMTPSELRGPRETSMLEGLRPQTSLHVFPGAKESNFKLTMRNTTPLTTSTLKHRYSPSQTPRGSSVTKYSAEHAKFPIPSPIREETLHSFNYDNNKHDQWLASQSTTIPNFISTPRQHPSPRFAYDTHHTSQEMENELNHLGESLDEKFNTTSKQNMPPLDLLGKLSGSSVIMTQMNPEVAKHETQERHDTLDEKERDKENTTLIEVPETARPILISADLEQRVNMKSRIAFEERVTPRRSTDLDLTSLNVNPTEAVSEDQKSVRSQEKIMTTPVPALFTSIEPGHVNASKESNDLILANTPMSNITSERTSINDVTLPDIPSPGRNKDFEGLIPSPKFQSSPVLNTRSTSETSKLYADIELM